MQKPSERIKQLENKITQRRDPGYNYYFPSIALAIVEYLDEQAEQQAKKSAENKLPLKEMQEYLDKVGELMNKTLVSKPSPSSEPVKECEHFYLMGSMYCSKCGYKKRSEQQTSLVPLDRQLLWFRISTWLQGPKSESISKDVDNIVDDICQKFGQPRVLSVEELMNIIEKIEREIYCDFDKTTADRYKLIAEAIHKALKEKNNGNNY